MRLRQLQGPIVDEILDAELRVAGERFGRRVAGVVV
jgi:hypothetical protein